MRIGNNISAMNTLNRLSFNNSSVSKSLEKLSSGSAINRASDDAAGLAISEKMRAQIAGLEQASKNAQDGISLVQTAEGALDQTHTALRRMYTLAMQATNGTITAEDRQKIQDEIDARVNEIDRVADTANFNGIKLFDGSLAGATSTTTLSAAGEVAIAADANATVTAGAVSFADGVSQDVQTAVMTALNGQSAVFTQPDAGDIANATVGAYTLSLVDADGNAVTDLTDGTQVQISDGENVVGSFTVAVDTTGAVAEDDTITFNFTQSTAVSGGATAPTAPADVVVLVAGELEVTMGEVSFAGNATMAQQNDLLTALTGTGITFTATVETEAVTGITASLGGYTFSAIDPDSDEQTLTITDANGAEVGTVTFTLSNAPNDADATGIADGDLTGTAGVYTGGTRATTPGLKLQIGASSDGADQINVEIADMHAAELLGFEDGQTTLDVSTADNAHAAIDNINAAIERVSTQRAALGAVQNRLEQTIENLTTTAENMSAAESRIRDVDMAKEMTNFTKFSILSQAAQAMLAQANALPQGVLQLLG